MCYMCPMRAQSANGKHSCETPVAIPPPPPPKHKRRYNLVNCAHKARKREKQSR